jgi:hypothetical protein
MLLLQFCVLISTSLRRAQVMRRMAHPFCQHHFDRAACRFVSKRRGIGVSLSDSATLQDCAWNRESSTTFFGRAKCDLLTICTVFPIHSTLSPVQLGVDSLRLYLTSSYFPVIPSGIHLLTCSLLICTSHSFLFFESVIYSVLNLLFLLTLAWVCSSSQPIPNLGTPVRTDLHSSYLRLETFQTVRG